MELLWTSEILEIYWVQTVTELGSIAEPWERFSTHPSNDPRLYQCAMNCDPQIVGPAIFVAQREGEPIAMLISRIEKKQLDFKIGYCTVYRPWARVLACIDRGFIGAPDDNIANGMVQAIMSLLRRGEVDYAHFSCLEHGTSLRSAVSTLPPRRCRDLRVASEPRWTLTLPRSYETFLASRSGKTRKHIRANDRRLRDQHPTLRTLTCSRNQVQECAELFGDVHSVFRRTYQYRLRLSHLAAPWAERWWREACVQRRLVAAVVYVAGQPVAFSYALVRQGSALLMAPGYDPEFSSLRVGEFAMLELIRALINEGSLENLDYGLGYAQYKESLGSKATTEGHLRIFAPSLRGLYLNWSRALTVMASEALSALSNFLGLRNMLKRSIRARKPEQALDCETKQRKLSNRS